VISERQRRYLVGQSSLDDVMRIGMLVSVERSDTCGWAGANAGPPDSRLSRESLQPASLTRDVRVSSIAANFDWRLFAPMIVSRRPDGSRVIIDGQHRWAGAVRRCDLSHLPCCLFTCETPEAEAPRIKT
jgi:hypothetical protein